MPPVNSRYSNWIFRPLLTGVYLLLFALQLNGRFYLIANFFVYSANVFAKHDHGMLAPEKSGHALVFYRGTTSQKAHLSLDKRYHGQSFLYTFGGHSMAPPCNLCSRPLFGLFTSPPVLRSISVHLLRGPPSAIYSI